MTVASLRLVPIFQRKIWNGSNGRSRARLIYLKRACLGYSPWVTFALATLSGWLQLLAKDRLQCLSCIKCSPSDQVMVQCSIAEGRFKRSDKRGGTGHV